MSSNIRYSKQVKHRPRNTNLPPLAHRGPDTGQRTSGNRRKAFAVVVLTLLAIVGYVALMSPTRGSLLSGGASLCVPSHATAGTQISLAVLDNADSPTAVTVRSVALGGAADLELVSAWVLPIEDWQHVRMGAPFDSTAPQFDAATLIDVDGHSLVPALEQRGLLLESRSPASGGSSEQIRVEYGSGRSEYFVDGTYALQLAPVGQNCS